MPGQDKKLYTRLQPEDAEDDGIAYKYYQRIEAPGSKLANITMRILLKTANALEVEPHELFIFEDTLVQNSF